MQCQKTISISTSNQQDQRSVFGSGVINGSNIVINAVEGKQDFNYLSSYVLNSLFKSKN